MAARRSAAGLRRADGRGAPARAPGEALHAVAHLLADDIDRQQGFIQAPKAEGGVEKVGFMTFAAGMVSPDSHSFADIREITELAAEARRLDAAPASSA